MRFQYASKEVGFYGLKPGVQMRSSTDPNFKIDWEPFDTVSRHKKAFDTMEIVIYYPVTLIRISQKHKRSGDGKMHKVYNEMDRNTHDTKYEDLGFRLREK